MPYDTLFFLFGDVCFFGLSGKNTFLFLLRRWMHIRKGSGFERIERCLLRGEAILDMLLDQGFDNLAITTE